MSSNKSPSPAPSGGEEPPAPVRPPGAQPAGYTREMEVTKVATEIRRETYVTFPEMPTEPRGQDVEVGEGDPRDDRDDALVEGTRLVRAILESPPLVIGVGAAACYAVVQVLSLKLTISIEASLTAPAAWIVGSLVMYFVMRRPPSGRS